MLASKWIETTIGAQVTLQRGFDITRAKQARGDIPVVSSGGISSFHDTAAVCGPGVVLGRKGVVGSVYYIDVDYWPHDTTLWVKDFHGNLPRFIYYFFKYLTPLISSMDVGSANPTLNRNHVHPIRTRWPSKSEQRAIAGVLGALDDKVELNRLVNLTLESMAHAVYLQMVRTAGGKDRAIGDVVTIVGGSTPRTTKPEFWKGGENNWATPKDLAPLQSPILLRTNNHITQLGLKQISSGLLPVGTVLLSSRAPIGYLAISEIPTAVNQGFIAIKCSEEVPNYLVLSWLQENMEAIVARANGTTFLEISKESFRPMRICVPPPEKVKVFVYQVEPLYQKMAANLKESGTLETLRDALLPKLMRGELRVKDTKECP